MRMSDAKQNGISWRKGSKYRNVKCGSYASKREAKRAEELKLLEAAGKITNLREQVEYVLIPKQVDANGKCIERACEYIADFAYLLKEDGEILDEIVEDAKGYRDPVYRIKRKLMLSVHGIRIREV